METQQETVVEEANVSSFSDRLTNVFTAPGELYSEVAQAPIQTSSWLIPYLVAMLLALLSTISILSNQTLRDQALEPQRQAMQERVDKGEMTQEQMDRATEMTQSSVITLVFGSVSALVMVTVMMFGAPLVLWLLVKFAFKSPAGYKKMLEVYGIAMLISILGSIISLLMIHLFGSIYAAPGGSFLLMDNFNRHNFGHMVLASLNLVTIWQMVVLGIGVSKVIKRTTGTGIGIMIVLWLIWVVITSLLGGMR